MCTSQERVRNPFQMVTTKKILILDVVDKAPVVVTQREDDSNASNE